MRYSLCFFIRSSWLLRLRVRRPAKIAQIGRLVCAAAGLVVLAVLGGGPASAAASTQSRALTRQAYEQAYALHFAESVPLLGDAARADPQDPAPYRAIAAITWMEILFTQGVATFHAFQGDSSGDSAHRPDVDPGMTARFIGSAVKAIELAERQVAKTPVDPDALYQLGAGAGLLALYHATVEGRTWAAFVEGRRAVRAMERVRQQQRDHREAALILGMYRYAVSTLAWPKRTLASAAGMPGDRAGGIALLEAAAEPAAETATDAALVLVIVYNREGRPADAMRHLRRLREKHPANRLLTLNAAATALTECDAVTARDLITPALSPTPRLDTPRVLGERALWYCIRGAARAALSDGGADDDFHQALAGDARDWIRARTYIELARLALRAGDERQARVDVAAAERFGRSGGDGVAVESAGQLWRERTSSVTPDRLLTGAGPFACGLSSGGRTNGH